MENLNKDIISLIGIKLDLLDLRNYSLTCKKIRNICNTKYFWYNKLQKDYPTIDISNVTEHKQLYYYLSIRIKKENEINILYGYVVYKFFPNYTPFYYYPFTNIFKIEYKKMQEIYENISIIQNNISSFVYGNFGEKYHVIFKTDKDLRDFTEFNNFKNEITREREKTFALRVRCINGYIIINFQDVFETLF